MAQENIELAFRTAEKHLGIPAVLSADELLTSNNTETKTADEKAVMNYVCMLVSAANAVNHEAKLRQEHVSTLNDKMKEQEQVFLMKQQQADDESKRLMAALETNEVALATASEQETKWREAASKWRESAMKWKENAHKYKRADDDKATDLMKLKQLHEQEIHRLHAEIYRQHREHEEVLNRIRDDKIRDISETKGSSEWAKEVRARSRTLAVKKAIQTAASTHDLLMGMDKMRGWLMRRRPNAVFHASRFKKVYFVLNGDSLDYYNEEGGKQRGSFLLSQYKCAAELEEMEVNNEIVIRLHTIDALSGDKHNNVLDFYCTIEDASARKLLTHEATRMWKNAINTRIAIIDYIAKKDSKKGTGWGVPELIHFVTEPRETELVIEDRINLREPLLTLQPALLAHTRLTYCSLTYCSLEDPSVQVLAAMLKRNANITALDLSHNLIGPAGAKHLMEGMLENHSVRRVTLDYNEIGDEGVVYLSSALRSHFHVTELNLASNGIGDAGVVALCQALTPTNRASARTLATAIMEANFVTNGGMATMMTTTVTTTTIKSTTATTPMVVGEVDLANEAAMTPTTPDKKRVPLMQPLSKKKNDDDSNSSSTNSSSSSSGPVHPFPVIHLARNFVGDKACAAISDLIIQNDTIKCLNLEHNIIGDEGLKSLSSAMSLSDDQIRVVELSSNQISSRGLVSLAQALKSMKGECSVDLSDNALVSRSGIGAMVDPELVLDYKLLKIYKPTATVMQQVNTVAKAKQQRSVVTLIPTTTTTSTSTGSPNNHTVATNAKGGSTNTSKSSLIQEAKASLSTHHPHRERRVSFHDSVLVASSPPTATVGFGDDGFNTDAVAGATLALPNDDHGDDDEEEEETGLSTPVNIDANSHAKSNRPLDDDDELDLDMDSLVQVVARVS